MVQEIRKKPAGADSKKRILKSAAMLFAKKGYGNSGLRELAASADVNLAMINYFFGSKKSLLKEIIATFFSGYLEVAQKELKGDENISVKLDRFIHGAISYFSQNPEYLLVTITELPHDDPDIIEYKASFGKQMAAVVEEHLNTSQSDIKGDIPPSAVFCSMLTSMMASRFLFSPVMERVQPMTGEISMEGYADIVSKIFINGVLNKTGEV